MQPTAPTPKPFPRRAARFVLRWSLRLIAAAIIVGLVVLLVVFRTALYHRFVTFPREAAAWQSLAEQRRAIAPPPGWQEYRGVFHSHSHFSHDSDVEFTEILEAAHEAEIDFIFLTDHCGDGKADFSLQWRGIHDGVLFGPGFEMAHGFMPWGLPSDTILNCSEKPEVLAEQIAEVGGLLFFAHTEEDRLWELPQLNGMEIYNIHTDLKDEGRDIYQRLLPDIMLSIRKYPDHVIRLIYDRQDQILANWDNLNRDRQIVGIAASDAHRNNGFRGTYTEDGNLLVRPTSPDEGSVFDLNFLTRGILRMVFGPLEPGRQLFRFDLDPYARSLRFVNTHVLSTELTEEAILDNVKHGRVFIAFDMLADARGFSFTAHNGDLFAVMGGMLPLTSGTELRIASPLPCRVTIKRGGEIMEQREERDVSYRVNEPGKYRVEAELAILGKWTPWVYTNPVEIVAGVP